MTDAPKAQVTIAVSSSSGLADRFESLLGRVRVDVDRVSLRDDLRRIAAEAKGRVLLVDRADLPDDPTAYVEELLCQDDAPALVVVEDGDHPLERAQLLAAGAAHVIDPEEPESRLQETLAAIVEGDAGVSGPEIRGNDSRPSLSDFISRSNAMRRFVTTAERVADAACSLLITGETGVGKERLARAIHAASALKGPFVGLNCGALPEALLESQLFGHEAGAFTGAGSRHKGYFEQATGGTVFLDEVGEIPSHLQVKLLTVLQRHEVQPLGAEVPVPVDVRVMAATNRDPRKEVREGRLREDLYFRLNVIHLRIPPLRNRVQDIPDLVGGLIQFFRCDLAKTSVENISGAALEALMAYGWPGNIRELINVIERAMILSDGPLLEADDFPQDISGHSGEESIVEVQPGAGQLPPGEASLSLKEVREAAAAHAERVYLDLALRQHGGRLADVARHAKIGTRSLYDKMRRHGLKKEEYRKPADG